MARRKSFDHRDFTITGPMAPPPNPKRKPDYRARGAGARWWQMDPDEAASGISSNLSFWARSQRWRVQQLNRFARFYGNLAKTDHDNASFDLAAGLRSQFGEQVSYNVSGSATDTLVSKVTRNKPKPYFLTDNGDRKSQRIAKDRNTFVQGVFAENRTYAKTRLTCRDSFIWGDGLIYVLAVNGRVSHQRIQATRIFVDELEAAMYGGPRQMHMISFVDRNQLMEQYPDKADLIEKDSWDDAQSYAWIQSLADLVCVRDSWHLPSDVGADDGCYVRTIGNVALVDPKQWRRDSFPFARLTYCKRPEGYWGQGLIEQGQSIQIELDKVAWCIQQNIELAGGVKLFLPAGSNVSPDQITNDIGSIIEGTVKPEWMTPPIMQPEIYAYRDQLIASYYNLAGVSMADASSSKPKGDLSGEALELIHDIGTERFASFGQDFEDFHNEIARLSILTAQDIVEDAKAKAKEGEKVSYTVTVRKRATARTIDFAELEFKPDEEWVIECFPVSTLPSDPAGRAEKAQQYAQAGWIDADTARELIDFPDTGRVEGLHNARREFIMQALDAMIDSGTDYSLEKYDTTPDGIGLWYELAQEYYQLYKTPGARVPESRLNLIRGLIDQLGEKITAMSAPPPMPDAQPQAVPAAPPTSSLIPNAPNQAA